MSNLSIFNKFNFERKPVGVKFLLNKPDGIKKLDKSLTICEMLGEAHKGSAFYASQENFPCIEPMLLGMADFDPVFASGQVGAKDGVFKEARANRRIYHYLPMLGKGTVRYVAFSPLDELTFDPDVLIVTAAVNQAEILLRALCYSTGNMITTRSTPVVMCAWLYIYPFISGELNYTISGLGAGMKSRGVLPEGLMLISIPHDLLPMIVENLQEMEWVLPIYTLGEDQKRVHFQKVVDDLRQEYQK